MNAARICREKRRKQQETVARGPDGRRWKKAGPAFLPFPAQALAGLEAPLATALGSGSRGRFHRRATLPVAV